MILNREMGQKLFHELQHPRKPRRTVGVGVRKQLLQPLVLGPKQPDCIHDTSNSCSRRAAATVG